MKLLFLNLWRGKVAEPLQDFLASERLTDIGCFQETDGEGEDILRKAFPEHQFFSVHKSIAPRVNFHLVTCVHSCFMVLAVSELLTEDEEMGRALAVHLRDPDGQEFIVVNIHGTARMKQGDHYLDHDKKLDFPARLRQTETLLNYVRTRTAPCIIGGDFNMLPEAESIQAFVKADFQDLIQNYKIPTTRNHLVWDKHPENPYLFSDYVFVSPPIVVKDFTVPDVLVSDHQPMVLEIE